MKLVKHWRSLKPGQAGGFFMSDNLFLYWKNHKNNLCWQSWDGSKMEASHRHEDFLEYWEALTQIVRYSDPYEQAMISSLFMHMAS